MKKTTHTNLKDLPHIEAAQIRQLAKGGKCEESYVRKVLNGDRDSKSRRAKAIIRGAKLLNVKIENAYDTVNKKMLSEID